MSRIKVEKEPSAIEAQFSVQELCCFCWKPTRYWVAPITGKSVACCLKCAPKYHPSDLPSKVEWCRRSVEEKS